MCSQEVQRGVSSRNKSARFKKAYKRVVTAKNRGLISRAWLKLMGIELLKGNVKIGQVVAFYRNAVYLCSVVETEFFEKLSTSKLIGILFKFIMKCRAKRCL